MRDHPRICGEKARAYAMIYNEWGSPPHMRGKAIRFLSALATFGITPAYAGKRHSAMHPSSFCRDHPRICGEKRIKDAEDEFEKGSPPHMRGKAEKDPVAPCLLLLLYCRFLQFAIDLLDQAAIRQSAMLHLFCQLKMLRQRCQLIVCDP